MATVHEVGAKLVSLCSEGKFTEAMETLYADDIVSFEASGPVLESRGLNAVRERADWWNQRFEVTSVKVDGLAVNGPYFVVRFELDVRNRETGEATHMDEIALYEVEGDKIVSERFF